MSCLSSRVELVLVLSFLEAWLGSTALLCNKALWEHFLLSNRGTARLRSSGIYPQCIVNIWQDKVIVFSLERYKSCLLLNCFLYFPWINVFSSLVYRLLCRIWNCIHLTQWHSFTSLIYVVYAGQHASREKKNLNKSACKAARLKKKSYPWLLSIMFNTVTLVSRSLTMDKSFSELVLPFLFIKSQQSNNVILLSQ